MFTLLIDNIVHHVTNNKEDTVQEFWREKILANFIQFTKIFLSN